VTEPNLALIFDPGAFGCSGFKTISRVWNLKQTCGASMIGLFSIALSTQRWRYEIVHTRKKRTRKCWIVNNLSMYGSMSLKFGIYRCPESSQRPEMEVGWRRTNCKRFSRYNSAADC